MIEKLQNHPKTILFFLGCLSALAMAPVYAWPFMMLGYSTLLHYLTKAHTSRQAALYAFIFFLGYFLTGLYWVSSSLLVDFDRWWWALPFSFVGLPILLSLFPLAVIFIASYIKKYRAFCFIIALIIIDFTRGYLFTGFPWNMPAHTWAHTPIMLAILPIIGFYGLNILTIILFTIPGLLFARSKFASFIFVAIFAAIIFIPLSPASPEKPFPDNVIMIQANIPQDEKWHPSYIERNLDRYLSMSIDTIEEGHTDAPFLIIWPETAISERIYNHRPFRHRINTFLESLPKDSHVITGYLHHHENGYYNGLAVLNAQTGLNILYNKHHLVPFGEYMPFGLETVTGFTGLQSGTVPRSIEIGKQSFLPLICYEIIFPRYAAHAQNNDIILNLTNDAWFGNTAGPYQHYDHAIFRAVEQNINVIRLSGSGVSGLISNHGTNKKILPLREQKAFYHNIR